MRFYNVLKYVLMVVFVAIVALAAIDGDSSSQPVSQQPQTKFNF